MLRRLTPLAFIGPLVTAVTAVALIAPIGGQADAACTVSSYRVQTDSSQRSDQVRCLQQALNDHGFNSGPIDGWFGPVTEGAVTAYQQANGLTVDGQVGAQTAGALGIWSAATHRSASVRTTTHTSSSTARSGGWSVNWDNVARCESGGNWSHGPSGRNGMFSGGLMIMNSAWRQYGGGAFANIAGNASKAQQITVAERVVDAVGFDRAWQCGEDGRPNQ